MREHIIIFTDPETKQQRWQWVRDGGRTRLQELLLADYAAINRLKLKAE